MYKSLAILNSELTPKDLILSYDNHKEYCLRVKTKPWSKKIFLDKEVCSCFSFKNSKEGDDFWIDLLNNQMEVKTRKQEYLKEKEKVYYRKLFPVLLSIGALIFLIALHYLLSYLLSYL